MTAITPGSASARLVSMRDDARVGVGAAQEPAVRHAMQAEIARELRLAGHFGDRVDARRVVPDDSAR